MNAARAFRVVWRINGVGLLLLLVFVGGMALSEVTGSAWRMVTRATPRAAAPEAVPETVRLAFGDVLEVEGTPHVIVPLLATTEVARGFSSAPDDAVTRNLLFFDAAARKPTWLLPEGDATLLTWELLRANGAETGPVLYLRYELADADTNGDGEIDAGDARRVAVSGPGGERFEIVLADADEVLAYSALRGESLLVFFRRGGEDLVGEIDLAARKLAHVTKLPAPAKQG